MKRKWRCICSCASSVEGKDEKEWNRFPNYLFLQLSNLRAYPPVNTPWNEQLDCKWRCVFPLNTAIFNHVYSWWVKSCTTWDAEKKHLALHPAFLDYPKWCTPPLPYPTEGLGEKPWGPGTWQHAQRCCSVGSPNGWWKFFTFGSFTSRERSHIHTKTKGSLETHQLTNADWLLVVGHLSFQDIYCLPRRVSLLPQQQTDPAKVLHLSWAQRHPGWSCLGKEV